MDRKAARALAKATITATDGYALVLTATPDNFNGQSPVAVITSRSMDLEQIARGLYEVTHGLNIFIYVLRNAGTAEAVEDQLDDLVLAAAQALHDTGQFTIESSDAGGSYPHYAPVDGKMYRYERIAVTVLDEGSDEED